MILMIIFYEYFSESIVNKNNNMLIWLIDNAGNKNVHNIFMEMHESILYVKYVEGLKIYMYIIKQ